MRSAMFALLTAASPALAAQDEFTVYGPDYFASEWGPGPAIEEGFETICGCDLKFVTGDVLPRLLLEGERTEADVVIGLNSDVTKRARESGLFAPHGQDLSGLTLPIDWTDEVFLPFNWSQTAFVYDRTELENPPTSFQELLDAPDDLKIVIQDPRSSISGLALLLWVKEVFGDESEAAWRKLKPKVLTVTPGWSESYGLFTDGEADMVLSYTTSPAYHIGAENDTSKQAAIFPEGHYFMVELAAQLAGTDQPELARQFMGYVLSEDFQGMIAEANWSYPSKLERDLLPAYFAALPRAQLTHFLDETEAEALREPALDEWLRVFAQ
ncbi:thiamine transport system substrate-binding protein [Paracoccus isoporae]|uniref:Thiamine transport system substrate-binding protein n=1 Tax=Paracoccus isoporae TaxID=591205 RepID=A0A1G6T9S1_9RHOB|nr:thiamine ABC transporter substrate binding subunit [Paracoccus isoporae]SDD25791.1 thiamine transport system substrate-binding protein [Paracoccus isoporae]